MKTAIRKTIFLILLGAGLTSMAQIHIPNTNTSFEFQNNGWKYQSTLKVDNQTTVYLYAYTSEIIVDSKGDTVMPYMRILVKNKYKGSTYDLAYARFMQQPFESLNNYTDGIPGTDGIGYVGAYTSTLDQKDYQFKMIYFKDKDNILEIRLETSYGTYDKMEKDFDNIIKTIKVKK